MCSTSVPNCVPPDNINEVWLESDQNNKNENHFSGSVCHEEITAISFARTLPVVVAAPLDEDPVDRGHGIGRGDGGDLDALIKLLFLAVPQAFSLACPAPSVLLHTGGKF